MDSRRPRAAASRQERCGRGTLRGAVGEGLCSGVQLLGGDVRVASHGRKVGVTEILSDQACVTGGLA